MTEQLTRLLPVPILITSYNRINFLKQTIERINSDTLYPYYLFVVDNGSTDGSAEYLRNAKTNGKLFDVLLLDENVGQSVAFNRLIKYMESWQDKRPMANWVVFSNDDILTPHLRPKCWLEQMIDIFERHEEYDGLGSLSMRVQRMSRADIDNNSEIIWWGKGAPAVFRLMRRSDIQQLGDEPMGKLLKWNSNTVGDKLKFFLKKRYGFTTFLFANHVGFCPRKGFAEGVQTFTLAENKLTESDDKPYPLIDENTNEPIKIVHQCDRHEQKLRDDHKLELEGKLPKPEVTLIVLTCHRYDGLKRIIESIKNHTKDILYKILVVADNDDNQAYNFCLENNVPCILSSTKREFVKQANLGIYSCDTPYFVVLADDAEIVEDDWLSKGMNIYKEKFPDNLGVLSFNDSIQQGKVFIFGLVSKKVVKELGGNFYYPLYIHYGSDRETMNIVKSLGWHHFEESIHITHHHWQSDNSVIKDGTYSESMNEAWKKDQDLKHYRQENVDLLKERNNYEYL